jgi:hypothetical protein
MTTETAAAVTAAPYKILKRDGKYVVKNNLGETKATFADRDKALAYLRALYVNVKGAPKQAEKKKFTGDQKRAVKAAEGAYTMRPHGFYIATADGANCLECGLDLDFPLHAAWDDKLPERQVCKFCDQDATQRLLWAEGMAYIPACDDHVEKAKKVIEDENKDEVISISPIKGAVPEGFVEVNVFGTTILATSHYISDKLLSRLAARTKPREEPAPQPEKVERAFLTEVNGKTLITGTAQVMRQMANEPIRNQHMLGVYGKFVGAEKANRNGALWTTADLEMGNPSVVHGPLNWLHEARHVIGTIRSSALVTRDEAAEQDLAEPFIGAASVVWRWLYPDEASVVEMASDSGRLWYSMECVSERVHCGDCGEQAGYVEYMQASAGCQHMRERSATRRFENPTFLGGAIIVPPVRPGWADALASTMPQAAQLAEKAFEQAGRPDIAASEWEQMMAQVVSFAS